MRDWLRAQPPAARALLWATLVLAIATIAVQVLASDNDLAGGILQALTLLCGSAGSFVAGKAGAEEACKAYVRPHAGSALKAQARGIDCELARAADRSSLHRMLIEPGGEVGPRDANASLLAGSELT